MLFSTAGPPNPINYNTKRLRLAKYLVTCSIRPLWEGVLGPLWGSLTEVWVPLDRILLRTMWRSLKGVWGPIDRIRANLPSDHLTCVRKKLANTSHATENASEGCPKSGSRTYQNYHRYTTGTTAGTIIIDAVTHAMLPRLSKRLCCRSRLQWPRSSSASLQ